MLMLRGFAKFSFCKKHIISAICLDLLFQENCRLIRRRVNKRGGGWIFLITGVDVDKWKGGVTPPYNYVMFQRVCSLGVSVRVFIRQQIFSVEYVLFALNTFSPLQFITLCLGKWPSKCFEHKRFGILFRFYFVFQLV